MKTTFRTFLTVLMCFSAFAITQTAKAERTVGWFLLGGDTFTLGTSVDAGYGDYQPQTRQDGEQLVGSVPEQRDMDGVLGGGLSAFQSSAGDEWKGSSEIRYNLPLEDFDNFTDGSVALSSAAAQADTREIAYLPLIDSPQLGGRFIVEGDVRVPLSSARPGNHVAAIGMLEADAKLANVDLSGADFASLHTSSSAPIAPMWIRVAEFVNSGPSPVTDSVGNTFLNHAVAQICLMSGSSMERRILIPLDANGLQDYSAVDTAAVADYQYGQYTLSNLTEGFDRIWLQWFKDSNTVEVRINNQIVAPLSIDLDTLDIHPDQIYAMAFELRGDGELSRFAATPEPSSMMMMCFGMVFFGWHNRRQRRRARKLGGMALSITG